MHEFLCVKTFVFIHWNKKRVCSILFESEFHFSLHTWSVCVCVCLWCCVHSPLHIHNEKLLKMFAAKHYVWFFFLFLSLILLLPVVGVVVFLVVCILNAHKLCHLSSYALWSWCAQTNTHTHIHFEWNDSFNDSIEQEHQIQTIKTPNIPAKTRARAKEIEKEWSALWL